MRRPLRRQLPDGSIIARRGPGQPWLALLIAACTLANAGCGPTLMDDVAERSRLRTKVRRNALRVKFPDLVRVRAGEQAKITVQLQIAPGFYLPSRDEPDTKVLATWLEPPRRSFARVEKIAYPHGTMVALPTRVRPLLAYDGTVAIDLRFALHRNVAATRYLLPFVLHFQLCTIRGCEVPDQRVLRIRFDVQAADQRGDLNELAAPD